MDAPVVKSIVAAVKINLEVMEAHLPQCHIPGVIPTSAQVLVLVIREDVKDDAAAVRVAETLSVLLPIGAHLDVWPMRATNADGYCHPQHRLQDPHSRGLPTVVAMAARRFARKLSQEKANGKLDLWQP